MGGTESVGEPCVCVHMRSRIQRCRLSLFAHLSARIFTLLAPLPSRLAHVPLLSLPVRSPLSLPLHPCRPLRRPPPLPPHPPPRPFTWPSRRQTRRPTTPSRSPSSQSPRPPPCPPDAHHYWAGWAKG